jgi:hypothetical protein
MQELIQGRLLRETLSPQSWLDFAEIVDRIESKQKRLKSPHVFCQKQTVQAANQNI